MEPGRRAGTVCLHIRHQPMSHHAAGNFEAGQQSAFARVAAFAGTRLAADHCHRLKKSGARLHRESSRRCDGGVSRRDGNNALKKLAKDKKISEDQEKAALEEIQKMTDEEIRCMEELAHKKEIEVMQV